jgi:hypothetical protein
MHAWHRHVTTSSSVACRLDKDLRYGLEVECKAKVEDIENYEEVKGEIESALASLRDTPERYVHSVARHRAHSLIISLHIALICSTSMLSCPIFAQNPNAILAQQADALCRCYA